MRHIKDIFKWKERKIAEKIHCYQTYTKTNIKKEELRHKEDGNQRKLKSTEKKKEY